jgi:hypothetical protein
VIVRLRLLVLDGADTSLRTGNAAAPAMSNCAPVLAAVKGASLREADIGPALDGGCPPERPHSSPARRSLPALEPVKNNPQKIDRRIECHAVSGCATSTAANHFSKNQPYDACMTHSSPTRTRIQSIDDRLARLRAERSRLAARASVSERKRDTRRKILIGAAVVAAVQNEGVPALRTLDALTRWMDTRLTRPHDRAVFDLPSPESPEPRRP